ncbi:cell wall-binding repeat-containing protein [Candidatus Poriferisodalis sp.]|uniref:cell wall-binding repeat-containing protein n=1 Tax=Candidatus Poriferisodalis sp. TaxID=3101277 RepID=UPI003AF5D69A
MRRALTGAVLVVAVVGGVLGLPTSAAAQTAQEEQLAKVAVSRYGGADRYATSLLVADAVAADAGGSLTHVVMVSGLSWPDAVVAAPVAGALGAPVLMTPPGELRDDAAAFVQRTGVTDVVVVGATGGAHAVSDAVVTSLEGLGITVERVGRVDRYATGVVAARQIESVGEMPGFGTTAIVANGDVFADALVAGAFAARGPHPVLLTPRDELHAGVARYLSEAGISHVVLMGGTAALAEAVDWSISDLGISVTRLAGATRFDTAVKAAEFVEGLYAQGSERCFTTERIGLARARVPFDSFSAGPLLGRLCAPLLLASPHAIPLDTAGFLDAARTTTAAAGVDTLDLRVFGGDAAVSQTAIDAYLDGEPTVEPADEPAGLPAGTCGGAIDAAPVQLVTENDPEEPAWSPDCSQIVYGARSRLWIAGNDGSEPSELTQRDGGYSHEPFWSPDGTRIAYAREVYQGEHWESHIWVVNADGSGKTQVTRGDVWDGDPSWSPDSTEIVFSRISGTGRDAQGDRISSDRYIVAMNANGTNKRFLTVGGAWDHAPTWSPDGSQIGYIAYDSVWVHNTNGSGGRAIAGNAYWDGGLSWSPDGSKIAFTRRDGEDASIRLVQVDTASEEVLADVPGRESHPRWSPDGHRILFFVATEDGTREAWAAGASGRQVGIAPGQFVGRGSAPSPGGCGGSASDASQQLGSLGGSSPSWSPNCTHVVFAHDRSLWLMRNDGTDLRRLTRYDARTSYAPSWSPDGTRIAYARTDYLDDRWVSHIWLVNSDGTGHTQLTGGDVWDDEPSWSPDGAKLTFSRYWGSGRSDAGHRTDSDRYIAVIGADGSGRRALTAGDAWDSAPVWSPDGTKVGYLASDGFASVVAPDGSDNRRVAGGVHPDGGLAWSPDGTRLAFARRSTVEGDTDRTGSVVVVRLDDPTEAVLVDEADRGILPRWSPDGERVAYTRVGADNERSIYVTGANGTATVSSAAQCRPLGLSGTTAGFPLPGLVPTAGAVRVAVLFMDFADAPAEHTTQEEAELGLSRAETYLEAVGYGKIDIEFVPLHRWLRAAEDSEVYIGPTPFGPALVGTASAHAVALADAEFDFSTVDLVLTVFPGTHFGGGNALGSVTADEVEVTTTRVNTKPLDEPGELQDWGYVGAHEIAHNLGLLDMYPYDDEVHELPEIDSDNVWVFVDVGLMGLQSHFMTELEDERLRHTWRIPDGTEGSSFATSLRSREMLAWSRWQLGWLADSQVSCITEDIATVRLGPVAAPRDWSAMAAVPLNGHEMIVVESRRQLGYDAPRSFTAPDGASTEFPTLITAGVLVYTVDTLLDTGTLPIKFVGDSGNGQIEDFPVLTKGDSVTLRGYTISVTGDDDDTHTVSITRNS